MGMPLHSSVAYLTLAVFEELKTLSRLIDNNSFWQLDVRQRQMKTYWSCLYSAFKPAPKGTPALQHEAQRHDPPHRSR